ncbi:MAG: EAL domain-containing protein [Methyloprofundus sp.]|nr:EAL domain-containing protein [Methyloprofundus sp.]
MPLNSCPDLPNIDLNTSAPEVFKSIFSRSELGLIIISDSLNIVEWNPWFTKNCGIDITEAQGKNIIELFPILEKSSTMRGINSAINNGMSSVISHTLNKKPFPLFNHLNQAIQHQITIKPLMLEDNKRFCLVQIMDISANVNRERQLIEQVKENKAISNKLAEEKERAHVTLNSIADAVITTDKEGNVLFMNPVAEILTGIYEEDARNKNVSNFYKIVHESSKKPIPCPVTSCLEKQDIIANETDHCLLRGNDYLSITDSVAPILDSSGKIQGAVLVFRDVTHSRSLSAELNWQALHDPLTSLANRRQFESKMKDLLERSRLDSLLHHLLYLDLDQFKVVNDTCGHDAGDELLKQISAALGDSLRKTDLFARLGGDEFGILLESCDAEHALGIANTLRQIVEDFRFGWKTQSFKIGVSIGIASITGSEAKSSEILSAADAACYTAKENGRNRVHFHQLNASASSEHQQEMQWVSRLHTALDNNDFELYLQRIQNIETLSSPSAHYEVLLRMVDRSGKLIPPGAFLPAAERFNLISSIDQWVIDNVFKKLQHLNKANKLPDKLMIAINLSGLSMANDTLLQRLTDLLDSSAIPASYFCFEVTETAAISNLTKATEFLQQLRSKGCKIALDDFGSGLSSFAYLKELPVDYLKIDGYFVKDIAVDSIDKAFVESINQIGQVIGLETIAEFVEDQAILNILTELGVNYAQGYGIHKPTAFDDVFN